MKIKGLFKHFSFNSIRNESKVNKFYINHDWFLITNDATLNLDESWKLQQNKINRLFGYAFCNDKVVRNEELSNIDASYILNNYKIVSGCFALITWAGQGKKVRFITDPLCQTNVFYTINKDNFYISNNLTSLTNALKTISFDEEFLFDNLSYLSPLRNKTIVKGIYSLNSENILNNSDIVRMLESNQIEIYSDYRSDYEHLSYEQLKKIYIDNLNKKAKILCNSFEEVHLSLTGGADSRLAFSALEKYNNVFTYCFGDGTRQDRIISEYITKHWNAKRSDYLYFFGNSLTTLPRIFKALYDSSFYKLNLLNGYCNASETVHKNKCNVTGMYGVNVSGGVKLPRSSNNLPERLNGIPKEKFTYDEYVNGFRKKYEDLRSCTLQDIFYINNRGKSHYACESEATNRNCYSVDILYDPINIYLVKSSAYSNNDIDSCALSVDIMSELDKPLALFPYDNRAIPKFKQFDDEPLLNCFEKFIFPEIQVEALKAFPMKADTTGFNILGEDKWISYDAMLKMDIFEEFFDIYPFLRTLATGKTNMREIIIFYVLGCYFLKNYKKSLFK